ncbi:MAG: hypothetical protein ABIW31_01025 [Novosphingobium sp.]
MAAALRSKSLGYWWLRLLSPLSWSIAMRRLFLVTLPISIPVYVAVVIIMFVIMVVVAAAVPIIEFWSAPQQRLGSGYGYGYGKEKKRRKRKLGAAEQDDQSLGLSD